MTTEENKLMSLAGMGYINEEYTFIMDRLFYKDDIHEGKKGVIGGDDRAQVA